MRVGIIGSGGREHAICAALKKSQKITKIYCLPGNAGTEFISENVDINLNDFEKLKKFILKKEIDLIIVGPEKPLVDGIEDFLTKNNIMVFGPNKIASQLERSLCTDSLEFSLVIHLDIPFNSAIYPSRVKAAFIIT